MPAAVQVLQAMEEVVRSFAMLPAMGYVWVALESGAMRRIRDYLVNKSGMPAEQIVTSGYWKLGVPDHPDGDDGQN